ncbi:MAG: 2Fe-2S iron-sulfur cluster-binding protein [Aquabacterium sp.]|nr:2Fe-2S iron-sulfur cluster-binding protein [Aquabacterium sp.]
MIDFFINGHPVQAEDNQTVMQAAKANGYFIPYFCWHPHLSVPGNCRICTVEVEADGGGWLDIACNMPVTKGMRVLTDSDRVRQRRKETLQFITLNHPVDCGICDKAGECTLQDYHYQYNGSPSVSRDAKVHATKHFPLSERIVLDNERCILCTRCVRFTREISKTHALGVQNRGDHSLIRPVEDGAFEHDAYSDNVIDICPVGALLSRQFLHKARVWYLKPTASVCPGCSRGCSIDIWHRKSEWKLKALDARQNARIDRVTPRENPAVNGPWICNKARDLAKSFERARATQSMQKAQPVALHQAITSARALIAAARRPVALVSSWASNEELAAFQAALGVRFSCFVKPDAQAEPGEVIEDDLLIRADKNPNTAGAGALFPALPGDVASAFPPDTDLVLVWGEGFSFAQLPPNARIIYLNSWLQPENGHADVFLPISVMTERRGHFTNFEGVVGAFEPCFDKPAGVSDAEALFAALAPGGAS